jgi:hypothetical protein
VTRRHDPFPFYDLATAELADAFKKRGTRMHIRRSFALIAGLLLVLGGLVFGGATSMLAQQATPAAVTGPSRPAHIHTGTCANLGDIVGPMNNLTEPAGTAAGSTDVAEVQYSFTMSVPLSLDDILASDHAVNIHLSNDQINVYIACGNAGGVVDANGTLVVGLTEQNNSGYSGIAVLSRNATDPSTTDVSAFIAEGLSGGGAEGTPASSS